MPMLLWDAGWWGQDILSNSVFLRFGFDDFKVLRKLLNHCQEQSNEEARWVCCIYTAHVMLVSLWCIRTIGATSV